jgi:hypothetical protein
LGLAKTFGFREKLLQLLKAIFHFMQFLEHKLQDCFLSGLKPKRALQGSEGDFDLVVRWGPGGQALQPKARSESPSVEGVIRPFPLIFNHS